MKTAAVIVAVSAAVASATTGNICTAPGVFCAGESLQTNIYYTCTESLEVQYGNCADNLAGVAPESVIGMCYQSSRTAGDAVCEKNCVAGTSTLPASVCTPSPTTTGDECSETTSAPATTTDVVTTTTTECPETSSTPATTTDVETTTTTECPETSSTPATTTDVETTTTTECPETSSTQATTTDVETTTTPEITSTMKTSWTSSANATVPPPSNGTATTWTAPSVPMTTTSSPTTPLGSTVPTAAAAANRVGGVLAAVGMVAAYFL